MLCSYPVTIFGRYANIDYEVPPNLDNCEQPHPSDSSDDVEYSYLLPISDGSNAMQSNTLPLGEAVSDDELTYEDPGHIKEEIYKWFKQRNICKLDKNSVR